MHYNYIPACPPDIHLLSVPMSSDPKLYRQDGTIWQRRILDMLQSYDHYKSAARRLQRALKEDERARETNDSFVSYILGMSVVSLYGVWLTNCLISE